MPCQTRSRRTSKPTKNGQSKINTQRLPKHKELTVNSSRSKTELKSSNVTREAQGKTLYMRTHRNKLGRNVHTITRGAKNWRETPNQ